MRKSAPDHGIIDLPYGMETQDVEAGKTSVSGWHRCPSLGTITQPHRAFLRPLKAFTYICPHGITPGWSRLMASSKDGTSSSRSGILFFSFFPKAFPYPTLHRHLHCLCQFKCTIISAFLEKIQLSVASPLPVPCTQRVPAQCFQGHSPAGRSWRASTGLNGASVISLPTTLRIRGRVLFTSPFKGLSPNQRSKNQFCMDALYSVVKKGFGH